MQEAYEVNFDGLVGPTHNYSGLAYGNVASISSEGLLSNPKEAALQGLEKMNHLRKMGIKQAVLPPHERPFLPVLRDLGFTGTDSEVLIQVAHYAPNLLLECSSAAAMWTANAATMTPSMDSSDKRVHFTPANLSSKFHRSLETVVTARILKKIFSNPKRFVHHPPLSYGSQFSDEGAANHTRFCRNYPSPGVHLFVYGKQIFLREKKTPKKFPARQALEAFQAISKKHLLSEENTVFAQQNPIAIDAGVFHNDVISVGNQLFFLYHEKAFVHTQKVISELNQKVEAICGTELSLLKVKEKEVSLEDAVKSYLFNSQIVTCPAGTVALLAPSECQSMPQIHKFLEKMLASSDNPIQQVHYFNLHESMRNGGGPACLRLRVVLTEKELQAAHQEVFLDENLYKKLKKWIENHYRDRLQPRDLADPGLLLETREALDKLTQILQLGSIYDFQRT